MASSCLKSVVGAPWSTILSSWSAAAVPGPWRCPYSLSFRRSISVRLPILCPSNQMRIKNQAYLQSHSWGQISKNMMERRCKEYITLGTSISTQQACAHDGTRSTVVQKYPLLSRSLWECHYSTDVKVPLEAEGAKERRHTLNRLLYRSRQRGYLELDLLLGKWTEDNIEKLDDKQLQALVEVLDLENPDLWKWLTGQDAAPEFLMANPVFVEIQKKILGALNTHAPAETRAKLGQPWVRGWDDNRKVGGPQAGNQ